VSAGTGGFDYRELRRIDHPQVGSPVPCSTLKPAPPDGGQ
jgi:hypothetical protein